MTTQQTISLNRLVESKANVRRTGKTEGIGELAASIAAHGLRQNLNVLPSPDGKRFEVVAGARRLKALKQLAKAGKLAKDAPIPCLVLDEHDDPAEISLAENAVRTAMHPDDQCEAFRALIDKGLSVEEVAARFGVSPAVVRQRLKLAAVSPKLRALYRKGDMGLDHVMALAISDDHAAQEGAWETLPGWNRKPSTLKDALTRDTVPMTDRLAKFIGADAYVAAGGVILRDLFDEEDEGYLSDRALVTRLATERMEEALAGLRAEGWKWAKAELTRDYSTAYGRVYARYDDEASEDAGPVFTTEDKAKAGARVTIGYDGTLTIERGLIHPDDVKAEAKAKTPSGPNAAPCPATLSAAMVEDLTAHRTAALRVELARNPAVALAATVHALASRLFYVVGEPSCLALSAASETLERHTKAESDSPAYQAMAQERERWSEHLPADSADLFAWCLDQPQDILLDLLATLAALSVNAVQRKDERPNRHADRLAEAVSLDMREWWTPSVEGFYQRLPKAALAQAVTEAKVPLIGAAILSLKKDEAARVTANALKESGWLPEPLKGHAPALAA